MTVYIIVLVVYLGMLAAIGMVMSGRSRSVGDFAIGGRSVGPWVTALSFVAAYYSSVVIIGGGAFGWKFGLSTLWVGAGNVLVGTTLAWIILGRRVRRFTENLDAMTLPGFLRRPLRIRRSPDLQRRGHGPVFDYLQRQCSQGDGQFL